jgi:predicted nucleic acid-binding protein
MAYPAVLDANVLYGINVTDLLLTLATKGMFRPYWSPLILREVSKNLEKRLGTAKVQSRLAQMNRALPDANQRVPVRLILAVRNHPRDRHVLALAVHVGAPTIVTNNLKDFQPRHCLPHNVQAVTPDDFVLAQVHLDVVTVVEGIDAIAARRKRAPKTRKDIIDQLSQELPDAMVALNHGIATYGL